MEAIAKRLAGMGISPEGIATFKRQPHLQNLWASGDAGQQQIIAFLGQNYGLGAGTEYQKAVQLFTPNLTSSDEVPQAAQLMVDGFQGAGGIMPTKVAAGGLKYEVDPSTGGLRFENGVVVDPASGTVAYDPTSNALGSPNYFQSIQKNWDETEIAEWRKRLFRWGYLPSKDGPKGELTAPDISALKSYYDNMYANFGRPIKAGSPAGAEGTELEKFHPAEMRQRVVAKYREMYGTDPKEHEIDQWSDFIQSSFTRLQTKGGHDPSRAAEITEAKFVNKVEGTEEARFFRKVTDEKTELHDAIVNAVQMTEMLS